jgi:hypothetical protein
LIVYFLYGDDNATLKRQSMNHLLMAPATNSS